MVNKKKYIIPLVEFEENEYDGVCDTFTGSAHDQMWESKSSITTFSLDEDDYFETPLASPFEETNKDFEYSMNENW